MSIDELGMAAAAEIRSSTAQAVDSSTMLHDLHRLRRRRTSEAVGAVVAACAAVVVVLGYNGSHKDDRRPVSEPTTVAPRSCRDAAVHCLGADRYRIELKVPVIVRLPDNFQDAFSFSGRSAVEVFRNDVTATTGVTIMEDVTPLAYDRSSGRAVGAGRTAASMAQWLSKRPYLVDTAVDRTTVDGLPAWHVVGRMKLGAAVSQGGMAVTFASSTATPRWWDDLAAEYTLV